MPTPTTRALAEAGHARQLELVRRADRAAERVSASVRGLWWRLLALLRQPPTPAEVMLQARDLLAAIGPTVCRTIALDLRGTALRTHVRAAAAIKRTIPVKKLAALAYQRVGPAHALRESFDWADLLAPFRDDQADDANQGDDVSLTNISAILFPPPDEHTLNSVLYASGWQERLALTTSLGSPEQLASQIMGGLMLGQTPREIAQQILPLVQGVESAARRVARTESYRVASTVQLRAHQALGDLVVGYQIHATLDSNTRPWHRARHGTIYHAEPKPGQKSYHQMPHPPDEAADPTERPSGTSPVAFNCRCYLTPVLRE